MLDAIRTIVQHTDVDADGLEICFFKRFRSPPETKGYPYTADKISSKLEVAQAYVASTKDVPSAAAKTYIDIARAAVDEGLSALNELIGGELEDFRKAVNQAGIGLLSDIEPVK